METFKVGETCVVARSGCTGDNNNGEVTGCVKLSFMRTSYVSTPGATRLCRRVHTGLSLEVDRTQYCLDRRQ